MVLDGDVRRHVVQFAKLVPVVWMTDNGVDTDELVG